jgi:hypothetical protein
MKKLVFVVIIFLSMFGFAFTSHADLDPTIDPNIYLKSFQAGFNYTGEIYYQEYPGLSPTFYSYCIDKDTTVYVPGSYYAQKLTLLEYSVKENKDINGLLKAVWLMDTYGVSKNGVYLSHSVLETGVAVQLAIWDVTGQITLGSGGIFDIAKDLESTIPLQLLSDLSSKYAVLNIYKDGKMDVGYQDLLTPVPIPPTILLLGAGIMGIGIARKRIYS